MINDVERNVKLQLKDNNNNQLANLGKRLEKLDQAKTELKNQLDQEKKLVWKWLLINNDMVKVWSININKFSFY